MTTFQMFLMGFRSREKSEHSISLSSVNTNLYKYTLVVLSWSIVERDFVFECYCVLKLYLKIIIQEFNKKRSHSNIIVHLSKVNQLIHNGSHPRITAASLCWNFIQTSHDSGTPIIFQTSNFMKINFHKLFCPGDIIHGVISLQIHVIW